MNLARIINIYNTNSPEEDFDEFDVNDRQIVETIIEGIFDSIATTLGEELKSNTIAELDTEYISYKVEKRISDTGEENVAVSLQIK